MNALYEKPVRSVTLAELQKVRLFCALSEATLSEWQHSLKVDDFAAGSVIVREHEAAREMYVVLDGEMEVLKQSRTGVDTRVAVLGAGDWFGEMSILDVQPRSATVRALAPSSVLRLTAADFDQLYRKDLKAYALLVMNIARELSRRLRVADAILADLVATVVTTTGGQRSV